MSDALSKFLEKPVPNKFKQGKKVTWHFCEDKRKHRFLSLSVDDKWVIDLTMNHLSEVAQMFFQRPKGTWTKKEFATEEEK